VSSSLFPSLKSPSPLQLSLSTSFADGGFFPLRLEYAHDEDMSVRNEPGVVSANAVTMPQSLVGMSTDEMATLAKASLRKTDLLVMVRPCFLSAPFPSPTRSYPGLRFSSP
jgi:hypothetical protein